MDIRAWQMPSYYFAKPMPLSEFGSRRKLFYGAIYPIDWQQGSEEM